MIEEGERAPGFELPGVREGEPGTVDAGEIFEGGVVVLAFYPGDFNPACSGTETDLDELDLFTMQKDVTVLAISGDSVHSHRAFAEEYSLEMALLSDLTGDVAEEYGVAVEDESAGYLTKRAVFVVDHTGTVQYTWVTDDLEELPDVDAIRDAVKGIGDDDTAESRYRVGHARYIEGRRAFTSAMNAYEQREWMMSQNDFSQAAAEFDEANEEFNTAVRFSEDETAQMYFERAEQKAEALWRASKWLSQSAGAYASGAGRKAESLRGDAEGPLETVRELHDPPDPDEFPPEEDPAEQTDDGEPDRSWMEDDDDTDTTLEIDEDVDAADDATSETATATTDADDASGTGGQADDEGTAIDDEELEEITAELEEQSEATEDEADTEPEPGGGNVVPQDIEADDDQATDSVSGEGAQADTEPDDEVIGRDQRDVGAPSDSVTRSDEEVAGGGADAPSDGPGDGTVEATDGAEVRDGTTDSAGVGEAAGGGTTDSGGDETDSGGENSEEEIELDLTDPTADEDEEDEEDDEEDLPGDGAIGSGDHGVPDSL